MKAIICTNYGPPDVLQPKEDFTKSGETYDIIFDTVGKVSSSRSLRSLKKKENVVITVEHNNKT